MSSNRPGVSRSNKRKPGAAAKAPAAAGKTQIENKIRFQIKPELITVILLGLFFAFSLFLRAYLPYGNVFTPVGIKFTSNDSYFFLRLVDNLVNNFPAYTAVDPYLIYPVNTGSVAINFFVWLISVPAWIANLISPGQNSIDAVAAFLPAVMGALTIIPVYFIGKELFGRWAGILSAGLIAILPGEFLGRSILGFTDNHVAETLFTVVTMMFLILAIKTAAERQLSFNHLKGRDWAVIRKPLIFSLLAGFSLGIYIFTWLGSLLFVFLSFVFFVLQFVIDHLKHKSTDYLSIVGVIFFSVALLMALMISSSLLYLASLFIAVVAVLVFSIISRWMATKKMKPLLYPLSFFGLAAVGTGLVFLVNRPLFSSMVSSFALFRPTGASLTTIEMQPLISRIYGNPMAIAWGNFNISFFLSFIALAVLAYLVIRQGNAEKCLLLVWSLVILIATLGQRRFGYYLAVNVALLSGYLAWGFFETGFRWLSVESAGAAGRARRRGRRGGYESTVNYIVAVILLVVIFAGVYGPNILYPSPDKSPAVVVASSTPYAPSDAWVTSMDWLRDNTPEPMGSPDAYYQKFPSRASAAFQYPQSAYGVLAWWDYGYWITRIAQRIPNANPSQDPTSNKNVATFFVSQNETAANEMREQLNSEYIVIDHDTTLSKFWAIITWAGLNQADYFDTFFVEQQDKSFSPVILYYPGYYRSMAVRLFNFDAQAVTPESVLVISYTEQRDVSGQVFKVIRSADIRQFATIDEAQAFAASQTIGNWRIVSSHPLKSPVPLEAVQDYKLAHSSNQTLTLGDGTNLPSVKIFEYVK